MANVSTYIYFFILQSMKLLATLLPKLNYKDNPHIFNFQLEPTLSLHMALLTI